jgi:ATP-dependent Lon protease
VSGIDDPLRLTYLLSSLLDMKADEKQHILEEDDLTRKLEVVSTVLSREIALLEMKNKIESAAQQEMTDAQRQYYLRQQLKAIQDELGEGEKTEIQEVRARVTAANLPESVATVTQREIDRLERMTPASPEYQMIRTYIDWVLDVPWSTTDGGSAGSGGGPRSAGRGPLRSRQGQGAHRRVPAVQKLKTQNTPTARIKGPILCFVGPPGVGKTSLGQSIRAGNESEVRADLARRRPRRGGDSAGIAGPTSVPSPAGSCRP